jgi:hypothetical protein
MIGDAHVCHTGGPYPDCYRLVTVWQEPLGCRAIRTLGRLAFLDRLAPGDHAWLTGAWRLIETIGHDEDTGWDEWTVYAEGIPEFTAPASLLVFVLHDQRRSM